MHHLKLSKSFNFAHASPKIVKKCQFWAQWDKINSPKSIFAQLCPLILSKSLDFVHSGTEKQSKIYFCPTVSTNIVKKFQFCAQWAQKMKFGPTVSTNIVKKFRFCAQWDKINSPKSIFVPLCPLILSKSLDLCTVGQNKQSKINFCPTVSTNIVKKSRFWAQWDKKTVQNRQKIDFGPTVDGG